jgi:processive 1,2-diacylglycerol beta-glucosyltransferase
VRRVLILTSSGGNGLVAASEALAASLREVAGDAVVDIVDLPTRTSSPSRYLVNGLYNSLLRWDVGMCGLYVRVGELISFHSWGHRLEDARRIRRAILAEDPDVVVLASPWIQHSVAAALEGRGIPTISAVVDLGRRLPLGWVCNDVDRVIAPTEAARDYMVERGLEPTIVDVGGVIVHPRYLRGGNGTGEPGSVLLLAGYVGTGTTLQLARGLLGKGSVSRLDVMCGKNRRLLRDLCRIDDERLRPHGYVPDLLPYYRASEVVVSKCGAMTLGECIATGRPMVVDASCGVMPQEIGNVDLVRSEGLGMVCTEERGVARGTADLLDDPARLDDLRERMASARRLIDPRKAASLIVEGVVER